jgi:hypothetical protein
MLRAHSVATITKIANDTPARMPRHRPRTSRDSTASPITGGRT